MCDYHVYIQENRLIGYRLVFHFAYFLFQKATVANTMMMMKSAFLLTLQTPMDINSVLLLGEGLTGEGMTLHSK